MIANGTLASLEEYSLSCTYEVQSILLALLPTPYSLLPTPYSLKPWTFYLTQFKTAI
ncbi:MAG: hypothetical protein F6K56_34510 [Moorea sp. SIO3G5]|nr:hypothetical protein [Moorena sp. SIO3G5]